MLKTLVLRLLRLAGGLFHHWVPTSGSLAKCVGWGAQGKEDRPVLDWIFYVGVLYGCCVFTEDCCAKEVGLAGGTDVGEWDLMKTPAGCLFGVVAFFTCV